MIKKFLLLVAAVFALSAFAGEPVQTTQTTVTVKTVSKLLSKKSKRQLKALTHNQASKFADNNDDDYGPPDADDLDLHREYAKPKLVVVTHDNFGISSSVAAKLKLARQRAIERHRDVWAI